jgi:tRNA(Ile)-lysidine synthase
VSSLQERVESSVARHFLFGPGQKILVAVSGGLDSMVLLDVLYRSSIKNRCALTVAHFNHRLRGKSSDADERLVRTTARQLGLPFLCDSAKVKSFARVGGMSLEMAGRKLRHEFLSRSARRLGIRTIALAHHADDQLELFFLRLLRGSGGEGLSGMKWRNRSPVNPAIELVRPLLDATKSELRAYAVAMGVAFREDATNASLDIARNRVRQELLPLLRKRYQPAIAKTLLRTMDLVAAESEYVTMAALEWLTRMRKGSATSFESLPVALQRRTLQLQLLELGVAPEFDLIEKLRSGAGVPVTLQQEERSVAQGQSGASRRKGIPGLAQAPKVRNRVRGSAEDAHEERMASYRAIRDERGIVSLKQSANFEFQPNSVGLHLAEGKGEVIFDGVKFSWAITIEKPTRAARTPGGTEIFDADKVGPRVVLRHWRPGDRFQPIGMGKTVKLQDFFTNEKVARARRHELIIAETVQREVFWIEDLRIAERFKLTGRTIRRLKWQWKRL